jgi:hypothetical protein
MGQMFYGVNEWLGLSPRAFAFVDTTISAPLSHLSMMPMLALIAKAAPGGAEATRPSASPSRTTRTSAG